MQVFHDKQQGLLRRPAQQERQEGLQGLLLLLLGRHVQGSIAAAQRDGEEAGKERHGLGQRQAILHQEPLQLTELLWRGPVPFEL